MADQGSTAIAEQAMQAAIAEIEEVSPEDLVGIVAPDHADDHATQDSTTVQEQPAPAEPEPPAANKDAAPAERLGEPAPPPPVPDELAATEKPTDAASAAVPPRGFAGRIRAYVTRFWVALRNMLPRRRTDAQEAPGDDQPDTSPPESSPPGGAFRALDRALDAVNRPFVCLGDRIRHLIGLVAIVTIAVSILALLILPRVIPQQDAVTFLQAKRAQLDQPATTQPAAEPPVETD